MHEWPCKYECIKIKVNYLEIYTELAAMFEYKWGLRFRVTKVLNVLLCPLWWPGAFSEMKKNKIMYLYVNS
mgnify:FL=1